VTAPPPETETQREAKRLDSRSHEAEQPDGRFQRETEQLNGRSRREAERLDSRSRREVEQLDSYSRREAKRLDGYSRQQAEQHDGRSQQETEQSDGRSPKENKQPDNCSQQEGGQPGDGGMTDGGRDEGEEKEPNDGGTTDEGGDGEPNDSEIGMVDRDTEPPMSDIDTPTLSSASSTASKDRSSYVRSADCKRKLSMSPSSKEKTAHKLPRTTYRRARSKNTDNANADRHTATAAPVNPGSNRLEANHEPRKNQSALASRKIRQLDAVILWPDCNPDVEIL
jgi:hypothetical protein